MSCSSRWSGPPNRNVPGGGTTVMNTTYTSDPAAWQMLLNKSIGTDTGRVSRRFATATGHFPRTLTTADDEQTRQVKAVCDVVNAHDVQYVVFGSFAGRLQGVPLRTLDVDVVPEACRPISNGSVRPSIPSIHACGSMTSQRD